MSGAKREFAMDALRPARWRWAGLGMLVMMVALCGLGESFAQSMGTSQTSVRPGRVADMDQSFEPDSPNPMLQAKRLRQMNLAQHKSMVSDADKLLKLVTELNAEISKSSPASLNSEQLRKIAEIEKLAHSVRDKMRTTVQGAPTFLDPGGPLPGQGLRQ